jgi:hypothetical protein
VLLLLALFNCVLFSFGRTAALIPKDFVSRVLSQHEESLVKTVAVVHILKQGEVRQLCFSASLQNTWERRKCSQKSPGRTKVKRKIVQQYM